MRRTTMHSFAKLLPSSLTAPRISARAWLALAGGIGCGLCAYAGLYPRFDDGKLRIVLALTSVPFGAAVVAASLGARSAARAFGRTLPYAAMLGMASSVLPAAILSRLDDQFFAGCIFGFFYGVPTGALYGLPLGILSACAFRHVRGGTLDGADRAARVAGGWLFFIGLIGLLGTQCLDMPVPAYMGDCMVMIPPSPLPSIAASLASLAGVLCVAQATRRLRGRTAWLGRVRAGLEPAFRLRPVDLRDRVEGLPRVGDGNTVIEWCPDHTRDTSAYRMAASGVAIALIEDHSAA